MNTVQPDLDLSLDRSPDFAMATFPDTDTLEHSALLRLLDNCVTAMHMLDKRMADLEAKARRAVEESSRERGETRADIATLRTRTKITDGNLDQIGLRLAAVEVAAHDATARQAREVSAARADGDMWRERAESALARLAQVEERLNNVETGLERRLVQTESDLSEARTQAARMEHRATVSETAAEDMQDRLATAVGAAADQRARIACLQAKLAAATQASRYTQGIADMAVSASSAPSPAIIDLVPADEELRASVA